MTKLTATICCLSLLAVPAFAGATNDKAPSTRAIGGAYAPYARLAAIVQAGGGVVRSKNVFAVSHPTNGEYCIRTSMAQSSINMSIPVLTVDWSNSFGNNSLAQLRSSNAGCPLGSFNVLTFQLVSGSFVRSNNVGFTIVVP